jgi:hypothetical protein
VAILLEEEDIMTERRPLAWVAGVLAVTGVTMMASSVAGASPQRSSSAAAVSLAPGITPSGSITGRAAAATASLAGSQGIDTSISPTASAKTVHGRDGFSNLAITVNQTANLTNQTVSITWTGGTPTIASPGRFGSQYLQIFQCWGDADTTVADNPGPPPEQCEQGATAGVYGGVPSGQFPQGLSLTRLISRTDWGNYDPNVGVADPKNPLNISMPFRAVDGTVVPVQTDTKFNPSIVGGNFWLNPYYNIITTNEIAGAATSLDGKGAELFQVLTSVESAGLGCGAKVQPVAGGGKKRPQCWIVVVPRGAAADENAGTPFDANLGVYTSPLMPSVWKQRIAIPISFNPVESPCALGSDELRISGSETALPAVASWQVPLCGRSDLLPFSYAPVSDDAARQQLMSGVSGGPGMVVVSKPVSPQVVNPDDPVVYAPLTLSGVTIGFNVERNPALGSPADEQQLAGIRIADIHLTPRLVAKLLTQSYASAVSVGGPIPYEWAKSAPSDMSRDPDFLRFNPEFTQLQINDRRAFSGLSIEEGNSDAAQQVWSWMFADPEARAFLAGKADQWGMKVNPVYLTTSANPNGVPFGTPVPNNFPKSDPNCYQAPDITTVVRVTPPLLCGTDWNPYSRSFVDSARIARIAFDAAKIIQNPYPASPAEVWVKDIPQVLGTRAILALTDTPSAVQFGVQMASLSRAGDDGTARSFIAPNAVGLQKGLGAMVPSAVPDVLVPQPTKKADGAYPLSVLTYAAIRPLSLDSATRRQFADFLDFSAGKGQVQGLELGQLPRGFAPLPASFKAQATAAATTVRTLKPTPTTTTTSSTSTTAPSTTAPSTTVYVPPQTTQYVPPPVSTDPPTSAATTTSAPTTTAAPTTSTTPSTTEVATTTTVLTPADPTARGRYALPGLGFAAMGSALGALEITKRPRRARAKRKP